MTVTPVLASREVAEVRADAIRTGMEGVWSLIEKAWLARDWEALGYASWDDYVEGEFGTARIRLPREEETEVIESMRAVGMSGPAIAAATGVSEPTVRRKVAGSSNDEAATHITGKDGKSQPSKKPTKAERERREKVVKEFVTLNPDASRNEVARKTGIDKSWVTNWAKRNGHSWSEEGPSKEAVTSGGKKRHEEKKTPAPVVLTPDEEDEEDETDESPDPNIVHLFDRLKVTISELQQYSEDEVTRAFSKAEWDKTVAWAW